MGRLPIVVPQSVISVLGRLRQEDLQVFEDGMGYIAGFQNSQDYSVSLFQKARINQLDQPGESLCQHVGGASGLMWLQKVK